MCFYDLSKVFFLIELVKILLLSLQFSDICSTFLTYLWSFLLFFALFRGLLYYFSIFRVLSFFLRFAWSISHFCCSLSLILFRFSRSGSIFRSSRNSPLIRHFSHFLLSIQAFYCYLMLLFALSCHSCSSRLSRLPRLPHLILSRRFPLLRSFSSFPDSSECAFKSPPTIFILLTLPPSHFPPSHQSCI